jgi:hypothetical protein
MDQIALGGEPIQTRIRAMKKIESAGGFFYIDEIDGQFDQPGSWFGNYPTRAVSWRK